MEDVPPQRNCGGNVDILIGLDHAALITPSQARLGKDDEPTASRTRLGLTLQGIVGPNGEWRTARVHRIGATSDIKSQLIDQVKRFCDTEAFGTEF